jgi:hypothetical protein
MDETSALAVTAVRAIETSDRDRTLWSDADRAWASRAAAEVVGERAAPEAFVARRAELALERLGERHRAIPSTLAAFRWRGWITPVVLVVAFIAGVAIDEVGGSGRINILAPPVLGILAWNLAVYLFLAARAALSALHPSASATGPLRNALAKLAGAAPRAPRLAGDSPLGSALAAFAADWGRRAAPLYAARAARILHVAAAVFAAGVIAGLWLRGLAFEYRASWQSTFLDAPQVHAILSVALAPGAALTGLPIPDVAHVASIRSATADGGENAARWIYLYAATILALVIVPRLLLALVDGWIERRRAASFVMPAGDPYFRRVLRGFREGPGAVCVVPYSFTAPDASQAGLRDVVTRLFGPRARLVVTPPVRYGAEDALAADLVPADASLLVALFNATATPEPESHGAFVDSLQLRAGAERECIAMVDESAFRERWPEDESRLADRQRAWREVLAATRAPAVFIHLARPDLTAAEAEIERALEPESA